MREIVCRHFVTEDGVQKYYKEIAGESSETKPTTNLISGSWFHETDTGDVYAFDETHSNWVLQFSFQS